VKKTKILQLPSIVTSDNQQAEIKVNDEQAVTESTVTSGGNTNAGFGGFQEAGTTLSISPHIADDTYLLLNITLEVSGFRGNPRVIGNAQIPADRFTRRVQTVVTVPDRHTVVLGGLIGKNQSDAVDKVPFVGDIPILGELFKSTTKRNLETNLFLFVTPTILKNVGDFSDFDAVTCARKRKADELVGAVDIPFSNFVGCPSGVRCVDPATGMVRGYGSASDRLDRLGVLEATRFGRVDPERLAAEALARKRALQGAAGGSEGR
jgi:Flp pilus assembly secretin CpaC